MDISGSSPNLPEKPTYQKDFNQSVNLFEKSFQGMQSSTFDQQKQQYVKVMQESLKTMQESANGMFNQHLAEMKSKLSSDLNEYLQAPTPEHKAQVQEDIEQIKKEEK